MRPEMQLEVQQRRGFESNANLFARKFANLGSVLNKLLQLKRVKDGGVGAESPVAGQFWGFCDKK